VNIPAILRLPPNRVWRTYPGGRTLDALEGRRAPRDTHFAEDWVASTTRAINEGRESSPQEGYSSVGFDGRTVLLRDLMEQAPEQVLGREHFERYGPNTQFLLKLLDSAVRLHVQAHPTREFAERHLGSSSGKTEAYVILGIRAEVEEPFIHLGFQRPLPRERLREAVLEQDTATILGCFEKIPVRAGDVFYVPGGLPHAIGEGIFMIEIMEPTDFAVRLEFERGGYVLPERARFMGRDVEFALNMLELGGVSVEEVVERYFCRPRDVVKRENFEESILIDRRQTPCFSVRRVRARAGAPCVREAGAFHVGIVSGGAGRVSAGEQSMTLAMGDRFLVPHQTAEVTFEGEPELEVVLTYPPDV
jgi:mannose-6-phosphate isomerase